MEQLKKEWEKLHGYTPTDQEILDAYFNGYLMVTDEQENEIKNLFNF